MNTPFPFHNTTSNEVVRIPGSAFGKAPTADKLAWERGLYLSVNLFAPMGAMRLHGNGSLYANPDGAHGGSWTSGRSGIWYAIGDFTFPLAEFQERASLPHSFRGVDFFTLPKGSIINVGIASNRFHGRKGGMTQVELISLNSMNANLIDLKSEPTGKRPNAGTLALKWGYA